MRPTSSCTVGEKKKTPTGTPLQGQYDATHWQCDLPHPDGMQLSMFLSDLMDRLTVMRSSFIQLGTTGGSVELSIGWYSGSNSGDVFDSHLIAQLASLRMGLSLDVYAEADQAENDEISEAME